MQTASDPDSRSNSASASASFLEKLRYNAGLFHMRLSSPGGADTARAAHREMAELARLFEAETGRDARSATVLEIGFGARPHRAFALTTQFARVHAVDLDAPVLGLGDLPRVFRKNGFERGLKSLVRHALFDSRQWRSFHREMQRLAPGYRADAVNFVVGNAGAASTWERIGQVDLIVSFDVFEHIPVDDLTRVVATMRQRLGTGGIAFVRPMVFTGIHGGHDLEWYVGNTGAHHADIAWRHVLDPDHVVNTYLNRVTRREFRALFEAAGFAVIRDHARLGDSGADFLTDDLRRRLAPLDDYELFSNEVEFLLR